MGNASQTPKGKTLSVVTVSRSPNLETTSSGLVCLDCSPNVTVGPCVSV